MIRLEIKNGVQKITEICDDCKCHVKHLTVEDILVKGNTDATVKNSKGEVITRKTHDHMNCKCDHCG